MTEEEVCGILDITLAERFVFSPEIEAAKRKLPKTKVFPLSAPRFLPPDLVRLHFEDGGLRTKELIRPGIRETVSFWLRTIKETFAGSP